MNAYYTLPDQASQAISHNLCQGCGLCALQCPTGALVMNAQEVSDLQIRKSPTLIPHLCVHCGRCAAVCPSGTIFQYRTEQLLHMVKERQYSSLIFVCEGLNDALHSSYEQGTIPQDMPLKEARLRPLLYEGLSLPPDCHLEIVRCTGRLGARLFLRLALQGVKNMVVFACPPALCRYAHGRAGVAEQVQAFTDMLEHYEIRSVQVRVIQQGFTSSEAFAEACAEALAGLTGR